MGDINYILNVLTHIGGPCPSTVSLQFVSLIGVNFFTRNSPPKLAEFRVKRSFTDKGNKLQACCVQNQELLCFMLQQNNAKMDETTRVTPNRPRGCTTENILLLKSVLCFLCQVSQAAEFQKLINKRINDCRYLNMAVFYCQMKTWISIVVHFIQNKNNNNKKTLFKRRRMMHRHVWLKLIKTKLLRIIFIYMYRLLISTLRDCFAVSDTFLLEPISSYYLLTIPSPYQTRPTSAKWKNNFTLSNDVMEKKKQTNSEGPGN